MTSTSNEGNYLAVIVIKQNNAGALKGTVFGAIEVQWGPTEEEWATDQRHWRAILPLDTAEDAALINIFREAEESARQQGDYPMGQATDRSNGIREGVAIAFLEGFRDAAHGKEVGRSFRRLTRLFNQHCKRSGAQIPEPEVLELMEQAYHEGRRCGEEKPELDLSTD